MLLPESCSVKKLVIISSLNGREISLTNDESIVIYRPNEQKIVRRIIDNYF